MTDRELLEALDLEYPGLQEVGVALGAGDIERAKEELVLYLRTRKEVEPAPGGVGSEDCPQVVSEAGEELLRQYAEGDEDWFSVAHPEEVPERLYSTQIMGKNDHGDFVRLAQEYCDTGNRKYARGCMVAMRKWIEAAAPLPQEVPTGEKAAPWRTIFYSTPRVGNWTRAFFLLRDCADLPVDDWIEVFKAILHHLRYAAANDVPGMPNMVIHLFETRIKFGQQWPEFAESKSWIDKGVQGMDALLDDYFYPDGAYIELSYFAHEVFVRVAQEGEKGLALPPGFRQKVERIFDFPAYMIKPNGVYPSVNDNYSAQDPDEIPELRAALVDLGLEFTGRDDFRYIHTFGREGTPAQTSYAFPYAGFYVMRTDWSATARYLVFDGGKSAGGHNHVDKLNFELYAYGNTLVTDSGCGGPWASAWRSDYFVGPAGHNTIMVDGRGQVAGVPLFAIPSLLGRTPWHEIAPDPLPNTWMSGTHFDYAASRYADGYATYGSEQSRLRGFHYERNRVGDVADMQPWTQTQGGDLKVQPHERVFVDHERKVFFVKPDYWILCDRLLGRGHHQAESLFHFQASASTDIDEEDCSVRTVNGQAGLTILPSSEAELQVRVVSGQREPLQGWVPAGWGKHRPSPVAIYTIEEELPATIDTVLYPYPKGEAPQLSVQRLAVEENGEPLASWEASGLRIQIDQRWDYFLVAHERRALRRFGPVSCDGEIALLCCDSAGVVERLVLVNGSYVELEGQTLVSAEHTFDSLELVWQGETLEVHCHPRVGAMVWAGAARRLVIDAEEPQAVAPIDGRIRLFENWLD
jgi:hypothetical protein